MTNAIFEKIDAFIASLKAEFTPEIKTVENDAKAIGASALAYIENNGLNDLYTIATSVLSSVASGTAWGTVLSAVVTQGEAAGITIVKGAESVVVAQAQADLIAIGTIPPIATLPIATAA